jgi:hypothetical protein
MPLEPRDQRHLRAADGFIELGTFEEANARLEEIDPFLRSTFEVLTRGSRIDRGGWRRKSRGFAASCEVEGGVTFPCFKFESLASKRRLKQKLKVSFP